jgi:sugar lactone lactonase YvrE
MLPGNKIRGAHAAMSDLKTLLDNLSFPEGPRWRDGILYFSDFYKHEVVAVDMAGERETVARVPNQPSGLGWDPQGRLMIVSMLDKKLLRLEGDTLNEVADLSTLAGGPCNDMVIDAEGGAYVGNFGFDMEGGEERKDTVLIRVDPEGRVSVAANNVSFPNGVAITPDGRTLIAAETYAKQLTAWDRAADGALTNRRIFADLGEHFPDGICLDAEGAVWVASPFRKTVIRVREGGEVLQTLSAGEQTPLACILGGPDRRTLLVCTAGVLGPDALAQMSGRIEFIEVDIPHAGLP